MMLAPPGSRIACTTGFCVNEPKAPALRFSTSSIALFAVATQGAVAWLRSLLPLGGDGCLVEELVERLQRSRSRVLRRLSQRERGEDGAGCVECEDHDERDGEVPVVEILQPGHDHQGEQE